MVDQMARKAWCVVAAGKQAVAVVPPVVREAAVVVSVPLFVSRKGDQKFPYLFPKKSCLGLQLLGSSNLTEKHL